VLGGFKISCNYCSAKTSIKSPEQLADLMKKKSDSTFYFDGKELKCKKCGNKVKVAEKVVKPDEAE
jgi:hypothetical protein